MVLNKLVFLVDNLKSTVLAKDKVHRNCFSIIEEEREFVVWCYLLRGWLG